MAESTPTGPVPGEGNVADDEARRAAEADARAVAGDPVAASQASVNRKKSRRRRALHIVRQVIITGILLAVLPAIYIYFNSADHAPAPADAAEPAGPMSVGTIHVQPRDIPMESRFLAQTEASQLVEIRARVSGFLLERNFEEGQQVEQGQLLFQIDPEPFRVVLNQAEAQQQAAQARLSRAAQQLERFQSLAAQQAASASDLDQWVAEQQTAAAEVELQRARVAQAQLDLDYTTVQSPLTGMIGEALQDVGTYLSPTSNALLATVRQVDPIYVRYSVSEQQLLNWERLTSEGVVGDYAVEDLQVEVILPDGRVHPHVGKISYVDVAVDPTTGTAVVRATVANPEFSLRPGQFVTARVTGTERLGAILVPQSAVMQNPNGSSVYVVDQEGLARVRPVEVGQWYGSEWIIESGLRAGDEVIVDHLMQVTPGIPVVSTAPTAIETPVADPSEARGPNQQPAD